MKPVQYYFYQNIRRSEYLIVSIKKILGDCNGKESYKFHSEILEMAENRDPRLLTSKILNLFVWYYNMYISKDDRNNIDVKTLKQDLKSL